MYDNNGETTVPKVMIILKVLQVEFGIATQLKALLIEREDDMLREYNNFILYLIKEARSLTEKDTLEERMNVAMKLRSLLHGSRDTNAKKECTDFILSLIKEARSTYEKEESKS